MFVGFVGMTLEKLGAVKLNKILWFSEVLSFAKTGDSIAGARFVKQQFGPVPKAILPILNELQKDGVLLIEEVEYYGHRKRQFVCLGEPNISLFSESELEIIQDVFSAVTNSHTAASISQLTHDVIWKLAEVGEEIPLLAVLASSLGQVKSDDVEKARQRMNEATAA